MSLQTVTTLMMNAPPETMPVIGLAAVWLWNVAEDGHGAAYCMDGCLLGSAFVEDGEQALVQSLRARIDRGCR